MLFGSLDIIFILLIVFLGHARINYIFKRRPLKDLVHKKILTQLFYYKLFFGLVFMIYVTFNGGDSYGYWVIGMQQVQVIDPTWFKYYGVSTTFVLFVVYPFSKILGLSFFTGSLMFAFIGYLGFTYIYLILMPYAKYIQVRGIQLFPAILFLPNLHFWSSGVGKDSLIFFAIAIFIYSTRNVFKNAPYLLLGFVLAYHIRPHIGVLLGGSLFASFLTGGGLSYSQKFIGTALGIGAMIIIWPQVAEFLKVEEFSIQSFQSVADGQIEALGRARTGSAIDLSSYPIPLRIFTFLYRPLFFDAHNAFALLSSMENFIYLAMTFVLFKVNVVRVFRKAPIYIKTGLFAFAGSAIAFSNSLSNLGIALRMKNMTMIYLLVFVCFMAAYDNYLKVKRA